MMSACNYPCSHWDCVDVHEVARTMCVCGDLIGYDAAEGGLWDYGQDGEPTHLGCIDRIDAVADELIAAAGRPKRHARRWRRRQRKAGRFAEVALAVVLMLGFLGGCWTVASATVTGWNEEQRQISHEGDIGG